MRRRGRLQLQIDVDDKAISQRLRRAFNSALTDAAGEIGREGVKVAKSRIREKDAIWRSELINSFSTSSKQLGDRRVVVIRNVADHAAPVEHGAEYTVRAPPLSALIPWVESKLQGWIVEDGRLVPKGL